MNIPHWLQVAWTYVKRWWGLIPIIVGLVLAWLFAKNKAEQIAKLLKTQQDLSEQHRRDLAELQRIHDEDTAQRAAIQAQYDAVIARINQDHQAAVAQLTRQKQTELRTIITETHDNPEAMASRVNAMFGIPVFHQGDSQ